MDCNNIITSSDLNRRGETKYLFWKERDSSMKYKSLDIKILLYSIPNLYS